MDNNIPELYLYKRDRKTCIGAIKTHSEYTKDIRYNAVSEITFKIAQKYYDIDKECWVNNPIYDALEEDKLVYVCDDTNYFKHPLRQPGGENFYTRKIVTDPNEARQPTQQLLNQNKYLNNFEVYPETVLLDVGSNNGYTFNSFEFITDGVIKDYSSYLDQPETFVNSAGYYSKYAACENFIPVSAGDVLMLSNWIYNGEHWRSVTESDGAIGCEWVDSGTPYRGYTWSVSFYSSNDVSDYVSSITHDGDAVTRIDISQYLPDGGFIRVYTNYKTYPSVFWSSGTLQDNSTYYWRNGYTYPKYGAIQILSGERRCKSVRLLRSGVSTYNMSTGQYEVDSNNGDGFVYNQLHWFTIVDTSEEDDGINPVKTVTAYSYEYTLKNKTITLDEDTLPLYTPPTIYNLVNNDESNGAIPLKWFLDCWTTSSNNVYASYMAQKMPKGILNHILDIHPDWSLGNISAALMSTYRKIDAVDDVDTYSFLMGTIQELFHCFIVFDSDSKTISAYTFEDLRGVWNNNSERMIALSWDNSIQKLTKDNKSSSTVTALRVHTEDDSYSFGLINPNGNNIIYNFYPVLSEMNFVPEGSSNNRTLATAVKLWQGTYNRRWDIIISGCNNYCNDPNTHYPFDEPARFVDAHLALIRADTGRYNALSDYRAVVAEINANLKNDFRVGNNDTTTADLLSLPSSLLSDKPLTVNEVQSRKQKLCHSGNLKRKLRDAAYAYNSSVEIYRAKLSSLNSLANSLRRQCYQFTLNPLLSDVPPNGYAAPILNQAERRALQPFIKEGTWTDSCAVFSDTYGVDDIISTLITVYKEVLPDLTQRLNDIQYDFTVDIANIAAIPEFEQLHHQMYVGCPMYLDILTRERLTNTEDHRLYLEMLPYMKGIANACQQYNSLTNGNLNYNDRPIVYQESIQEVYPNYTGEYESTYPIITTIGEGNNTYTIEISRILSSGDVLSATELSEYISYIDYENGINGILNSDDDDIIIHVVEGGYNADYWDALNSQLSEIEDYHWSLATQLINLTKIPWEEVKSLYDNLYTNVHGDVNSKELATPILLERHINYKDDTDFSYTFTTDMKRKPMQFRFSDLYSTITQTSVTNSAFTFDE